MSKSKPPREETPFEKFKQLTTRVVSVPRAEIQKREVEYKKSRGKTGKRSPYE